MKRTVSQTEVGSKLVRYRTRIEDDPSIQGSWESRNRLMSLFETIITAPNLIECGLAPPQSITIKHTGSNWVLEAEATIDTGA